MAQPKKPLGPKTRLWLASRGFTDSEQKMINVAAERFYDAVISVLEPQIQDAKAKVDQAFAQASLRINAIPNEVAAEGRIAVRNKIQEIESKPQLQGMPGKTPQKGVDYHDGEHGKTPQPGVDYFTKEQTEKLIGVAMSNLFDTFGKNGLSPAVAKRMMASMIENMPVEKLVRAIEKLPEKEKLDYYKGLKNTPLIPTEASQRRTLHRGLGGLQTYNYDLSDLCDGNTRVFTIPTNTRVLEVGCTDAPNGRYRPAVDWTGSGTTTLTLSNDVAAPTEGATLYILYVA